MGVSGSKWNECANRFFKIIFNLFIGISFDYCFNSKLIYYLFNSCRSVKKKKVIDLKILGSPCTLGCEKRVFLNEMIIIIVVLGRKFDNHLHSTYRHRPLLRVWLCWTHWHRPNGDFSALEMTDKCHFGIIFLFPKTAPQATSKVGKCVYIETDEIL